MFLEAIRDVQCFALPIVISSRRVNGKCLSGIATFVVINRDGWAVTAWHVIEHYQNLYSEAEQVQRVLGARAAVRGDTTLSDQQRRRKLKEIGDPKSSAISNMSAWWSFPRPIASWDVVAIPTVDLAFVRLDGFDPAWVRTYPKFKNPSVGVDPGRSLCRVGFPFHTIEPIFHADRNTFELPPGSLPLPRFPNEGIFTRNVEVVLAPESDKPTFPLRFLETSSPGLKGQSGGPIFDVQGRIWAIQSQTCHYPLGFSPPIPNGRAGEVEHQFLNVGRGVHVATVIGAMRAHGIQFAMSDD